MKDDKLTNEDVLEFEKGLLDTFRPIVAKIGGEKIPNKLTKQQRREIKEIWDYFGELGKKTVKLDSQTLPQTYKNKQMISIFDEVFGAMYGDDKNIVDKIVVASNPKQIYDKVSISQKQSQQMQETMHRIFYKIESSGNLEKFDKFLQTINQDTFIATTQSAYRINDNLAYILKPRKRITKEIIEKYIITYKEVSGFLETFVIILYGINLIINQKYKSFSEIKNNFVVGNMIKILKNVELFKKILGMYTPTIRNSVIHISYQIDPLNKTLEFSDKKTNIVLTFEEFILYVQEITRSAILVSQLEREYNYLRLLGYKQKRDLILKMKD